MPTDPEIGADRGLKRQVSSSPVVTAEVGGRGTGITAATDHDS